ncbi:MAG: hypothetical protein ACJA2W_000221 [Planctomycetota bacterium]|jgi:hypothetical protein
MSSCLASYSVAHLPINPAGPCAVLCAGVTFELESMTTTTSPDCDCEFSWTVVRTKRDASGEVVSVTKFLDEDCFGCPNVKKVTFYCDAAKACPAYELTLICMHGAEPTEGIGVTS